jgi:hypothetical protein
MLTDLSQLFEERAFKIVQRRSELITLFYTVLLLGSLKMKALQATIVDGIHNLALKDVPKPSIENPNQILVKVIAAAVNPSDIINSKGTRTPNLLSNSGLSSTCGKRS